MIRGIQRFGCSGKHASTAARAFTRGLVCMPPDRVLVMGVPVLSSTDSISSAVEQPASRNRAVKPVT